MSETPGSVGEAQAHLQAAKDEVVAAARAAVSEYLAGRDADEKLHQLSAAIDRLDEPHIQEPPAE